MHEYERCLFFFRGGTHYEPLPVGRYVVGRFEWICGRNKKRLTAAYVEASPFRFHFHGHESVFRGEVEELPPVATPSQGRAAITRNLPIYARVSSLERG